MTTASRCSSALRRAEATTAPLVYDAFGFLLVGLTLGDWGFVEQLHDYLGQKTPIPYYDVALFHDDDSDLFSTCLESERAFYAGGLP